MPVSSATKRGDEAVSWLPGFYLISSWGTAITFEPWVSTLGLRLEQGDPYSSIPTSPVLGGAWRRVRVLLQESQT